MMDEEKLIPDLTEYRRLNTSGFSIDDWTAIEGNIKFAIGYSFLFWPEFIEYDNCIFLKSRFSIDTFKHWEASSYSKNYAAIESIINHFHIVDLFATPVSSSKRSLFHKIFNKKNQKQDVKITKEQVVFLGNKLRDIYRTKLSIDFPDKKFDISFDFIDNPDNLEDYQLIFYQTDNENRLTK